MNFVGKTKCIMCDSISAEVKAWVRSNTDICTAAVEVLTRQCTRRCILAAGAKVGVCVLLIKADGPALRPGRF